MKEYVFVPPLPQDRLETCPTTMLSGITITCFAASYIVALALEVARSWVRSAWLGGTAMGFLIAGIFAHSVHLVNLARDELGRTILFSSWHDWCLLASWILALACLGLSLRRVRLVGIFMLPPVLALIGAAYLLIDTQPFERTDAIRIWGMGHGFSLLIGTVGVTIGFVAGTMFLLQAYRLKRKIPPSKTLKLPSLEWLQRLTEESLLISSFFLAVGLLTGVVLNAIQHAQAEVTVAWTEPAVWSSGLLLLWLIGALLINWLHKPARRGRKVAYLTMASFGFLAIVLGLVLFSGHAAGTSAIRNGAMPETSDHLARYRLVVRHCLKSRPLASLGINFPRLQAVPAKRTAAALLESLETRKRMDGGIAFKQWRATARHASSSWGATP